MIRKLTTAGALAVLGLLTHCAAAPAPGDTEGAASMALSSTIHSTYGITMFGGPGDYQPMACGLSSSTAQHSHPYYAASSQRYGCKVHLKLTTHSGRCVVVSTEDAGPATWVETKAGTPILDVSPATVKGLFPGVGSLGWSDLEKSPGTYSVTAVKTSLPLGPCDGAASPPADPPPSGDAPACSVDGQCNPGNDGSGKICESGHCVDGCRTDAQCPGSTTCIDGQCN